MNYVKEVNLKNGDLYNFIIEIPKGTNSKFELNDPYNNKVIEVRKVIGKYPFHYGCFPQTFAGDKDPLDVILLSDNKFKSLDIIKVIILGVIKTIDNGEQDDKIIVINNTEVINKEKKRLK